jgi:hypothetical protein
MNVEEIEFAMYFSRFLCSTCPFDVLNTFLMFLAPSYNTDPNVNHHHPRQVIISIKKLAVTLL